ncbi:uncharacterized protein LOC119831898 [Zerene cesonia]|uniref:uncharacterized protein LOC119831898 n=1 Tax=Zerene cesonia TaxID=33412 RepID=UPI0018E57F1F|nr:uncharacterized protein LOC119831898 [Zerene cesonia]
MFSLVHSNFNRTYNPSGRQNALCDIKRLLTSRDSAAQAKACGYLIEVISKYDKISNERSRLIEYLLENDITVFLCEVTTNLDFNLLRFVLQCLRLIWTEQQFFSEEHAPHAMAAVLRALAHFSAINPNASDACLHFLCDLFSGIAKHKTTSPLSHQSAYNTEQLLASFNILSTRVNMSANSKSVLCSALVIQELISYQPDDLVVQSSVAKDLVDIIKKWLELLTSALNHQALLGAGDVGEFLIVTCQIALNALGLYLFEFGYQDNINNIATEEYSTFLKLLLSFYYEADSAALSDFSDVLLSKGYLAALPKVQIERNDAVVRKLSTLILGEILKVLTEKYLFINLVGSNDLCAKDIELGLVELQNGIEKPQSIGVQLQKNQPYGLLIYIYFYSQSSENPEESTAPLLPYLVEYVLRLPNSFVPPSYIIKALWLVFAMSTISNGTVDSLNERVYLEKATDRLVGFLQPDPAIYYTHHPAILFWAFTSLRIPNYIRMIVLSQWLKSETNLPEGLVKEPLVWELLLDVLTKIRDNDIISNCVKSLNSCLEEGDGDLKEEFGVLIWSMLPGVLSKALIDCEQEIDTNICYFLDLATNLLPSELDQAVCLKISVLLTTIYSKNIPENSSELEIKFHYDYVCLKLCLLLLQFASDQKDSKVLLTYTNKPGFLSKVLTNINSSDENVACTALRLLSYIVHYFHKNNYQAKSHLQVKTDILVRSLRQDSSSDRGSSLLQLVYTVLSSGVNTPLVLTYSIEETPSQNQQCNALRALMFRIQVILCYRDSEHRSSAGWKTLSSVFKHAIVYKNDPKLVGLLTCQPWIYTLIRFQLAQDVSIDFLTFLKNWLILLKIAIKKHRQERKILISKYSLITRTMVLVKKSLCEDDNKETKDIVLNTVGEILEECTSRK